MKVLLALVKSSLVFVLVEGWRLPALIFLQEKSGRSAAFFIECYRLTLWVDIPLPVVTRMIYSPLPGFVTRSPDVV